MRCISVLYFMFHTRAIILSTRPYREHDELIALFTERFGKQVIIARGARKATSKLAATLHSTKILQCGFVEGRHYPVLTSADNVSEVRAQTFSTESLGQVKDFYGRYFLYALLALCDDVLYEGERDDSLWALLVEAMHAASGEGKKTKREWLSIYDGWLRELLHILGLREVAPHTQQALIHETRDRAAVKRIFAEMFYRNPYPLEPFIFFAN